MIALLVLYVVVLLVFIYLLLMLIDYNATLNWTIAIMFVTLVVRKAANNDVLLL